YILYHINNQRLDTSSCKGLKNMAINNCEGEEHLRQKKMRCFMKKYYQPMKNLYKRFVILVMLFLGYLAVNAQIKDEVCPTVNRLSDNVILLRYGIQTYDAVAAVNTDKGIIIIDTGISLTLTEKYKELIMKEFDRDDFLYIINTHGHYDHVAGNQIFQGAEIIAHHNCIEEMMNTIENKGKSIDRYNNISKQYSEVTDTEQLLPIQKKQNRYLKNMYALASADLEQKYTLFTPTLTFKDELILKMGNVTLQLLYFGVGHSKSDIVIYIPEEKILFTGSAILEGGLLGHNEINLEGIDRGNYVLDSLLDKENGIEYCVTNHGIIFSKNDLIIYHDKLKKVLSDLSKGKTLYTARMFFELINSSGLDDAIINVKKMYADNGEYFFLEKDFLMLAYNFLSGNKLDDAVKISNLILDIFPSSYLAYEIIAETAHKKGDLKKAKMYYEKYYKRSPNNQVVKAVLQSLN
ncbi:MAG: MBL fold metallo-hydrolase, partial [Candidatus Hodarchaeota archaeon]